VLSSSKRTNERRRGRNSARGAWHYTVGYGYGVGSLCAHLNSLVQKDLRVQPPFEGGRTVHSTTVDLFSLVYTNCKRKPVWAVASWIYSTRIRSRGYRGNAHTRHRQHRPFKLPPWPSQEYGAQSLSTFNTPGVHTGTLSGCAHGPKMGVLGSLVFERWPRRPRSHAHAPRSCTCH